MQMPLQIAFHGIERSEELVSEAEQLIDRLEAICGELAGCRIAIFQRGLYRRDDRDYTVHLDVSLPNRDAVAASRHHSEDPRLAMHIAFDAVKREIIEQVGRSFGRTAT